MTIRGVGVDLSAVSRWQTMLDKWGDRLIERVFDATEAEQAGGKADSLAARWATKEATAKAFGIGIRGFRFQDIFVIREENDRPKIFLKGEAKTFFDSQGGGELHLSLSHENDMALAFVIWESNDLRS